MKNKIILCCWLFWQASIAVAQNRYEFSSRQETYQSLSNPMYVTDSPIDLEKNVYMIESGFWFNFDGQRRYSYAVEPRGLLPTEDEYIRISGYPFFKTNTSIAYQVEGNPECKQRILKVEFKNLGLDCNGKNNNFFLNYQIWLYESSNIIEFRMGSSWVDNNICGNTYSFRGFVWRSFTKSAAITAENGVYTYQENSPSALNSPVPAAGTVWRLTPTFLPTEDVKVFPTGFTDKITITKSMECSTFECDIFTLAGKQLMSFQMQGKEFVLDTKRIPFGWYILRLKDLNTQKVITKKIFSFN